MDTANGVQIIDEAVCTAPIFFGKIWIQLFSLQQWVNRGAKWALQPFAMVTGLREGKL